MSIRIRRALVEAVTDTLLATPLNMLISWVILWFAFQYLWGPTVTMLVQTGIMFFFAVSRKVYLRLYFEKRYESQ
jgi:hypothetical protein